MKILPFSLLVVLCLSGCAKPPVKYSESNGAFRPINTESKYTEQQMKEAKAHKGNMKKMERKTLIVESESNEI